MILSDKSIRDLVHSYQMIEPFRDYGEEQKNISVGLSSSGYDIALAQDEAYIAKANPVLIDPLNFDKSVMERASIHKDDQERRFFILPAHSFMLARSAEYFRIPPDVVGLMTVKSTYARIGQIQPSTVLEPEWQGHITLEIFNSAPFDARIYAGMGIAQVLFSQLQEIPERTYADKRGKYQGQKGVTFARSGEF